MPLSVVKAEAPHILRDQTGNAESLALSKKLPDATPSVAKAETPQVLRDHAGTAEVLALTKQLANVTPQVVKVDGQQAAPGQVSTAQILALSSQLANVTPPLDKLEAPQVLREQAGTAQILRFNKQLPDVQRPEIKPLAPQLNTSKTLATDTAPGITLDTRPPVTAAAPSFSDSHDVFNINIHPAPGMDPQAIARAVRAELDNRDREKSARQRSRLSDQE